MASADHTNQNDRFTNGRRGAVQYIEDTYGVSVSVSTIDRRIADGSLPAYRFGPKAVRIKISDLDALFTPVTA